MVFEQRLFLSVVLLAASALAMPQYPAGVDPTSCRNYPFCSDTVPQAIAEPASQFQANANGQFQVNLNVGVPAELPQVPGLAAHQAAEAKILAAQRAQPAAPRHAAGSNTFTGLVGPSGVIGPSGLVGPTGPVAF